MGEDDDAGNRRTIGCSSKTRDPASPCSLRHLLRNSSLRPDYWKGSALFVDHPHVSTVSGNTSFVAFRGHGVLELLSRTPEGSSRARPSPLQCCTALSGVARRLASRRLDLPWAMTEKLSMSMGLSLGLQGAIAYLVAAIMDQSAAWVCLGGYRRHRSVKQRVPMPQKKKKLRSRSPPVNISASSPKASFQLCLCLHASFSLLSNPSPSFAPLRRTEEAEPAVLSQLQARPSRATHLHLHLHLPKVKDHKAEMRLPPRIRRMWPEIGRAHV